MRKIFLVGLGPGASDATTPAAEAAIRQAEVLCGYTVYLDLVRERYPEKEIFSTPMRQELARCRRAVELAESGRTVAMLCSGDAGVYGMAGPVLEMAGGKDIEVEVVPGITAAVSGAALLGAPLMNDFCVLSLSDLLTPREVLERRLRAAAAGDFVVVLYNPRSKHRPDHLRRACKIFLEYRTPETVCGWVRNIGREGQEQRVLTLAELAEEPLDMFCTAFVGSSATRKVDGRMITPRGYEEKQGLIPEERSDG